jgi:erythrocyte band 7 integral membrane protein
MSTSLDPSASPKDIDTGFKPGGSSSLNGGFRPSHTPGRSDNPMVNVQPPRREDLQPSYAQTLAGESDQGNHGWYGSMSKSHLDPESLLGMT